MDDEFDLSNHNDDQLIDIVFGTLETLCNELETRGFDPAIVDASLFIFWQQRMYAADDRESYEQLLEEALSEEWPDGPTIH